MSLEVLKVEAAKLSQEDRADLAYYLLQSLDSEQDKDTDAAWEAELTRREAQIRSGQVTGKPASEVFSQIREKYP